MIPLWLELHVDDVLLAGDPARWPEVAALLDRVAGHAEAAGARLSFRFRETFASLDRAGFIAGLVRRGHEAGWHAHGRRLKAARDAVVAAGGDARIAAPGLVQARSVASVLWMARALGCTRITDRTERSRFAYQGWLAWEPIPGMASLDVSISPFRWGVVTADGRPGRLDWEELARCVEHASRRTVPAGATGFFGATFHEHNLGDDDPLRRFLDRHGPRIVPSGSIAYAPRPPVAPRRLSAGARSLARRIARRLPDPTPSEDRTIGRVRARRTGPAQARGALVVLHGGKSGIDQGLGFAGLRSLPGLAVWTHERSAGDRAPGNPRHVEDARAVLEAALAEGLPTGILTWSAGIVPALHIADARVRFIVDCEGPCDRHSLVRPGEVGADPFDEAAWEGREAIALIERYGGRYLRIQGELDHVHGAMTWHAERMAPSGRLERVPGRIHDHGARIAAWIEGLY